jgi:hypothetical protein
MIIKTGQVTITNLTWKRNVTVVDTKSPLTNAPLFAAKTAEHTLYFDHSLFRLTLTKMFCLYRYVTTAMRITHRGVIKIRIALQA